MITDIKDKKIYILGLSYINLSLIKYFNKNEIEFLFWSNAKKDIDFVINEKIVKQSDIQDIDESNFDNFDYIIISDDFLQINADHLTDNRIEKYADKIFLDYEFLNNLFPNKKNIGIFANSEKIFIEHYLYNAFNSTNKEIVINKIDEKYQTNIENAEYILIFLNKTKLKYIQNMQFDILVLLDFLVNKIDNEEILNFRNEKQILIQQNKNTKLIFNLDDDDIKDLYNELEKDTSCSGKLIPISIEKILQNGYSLINNVIYNYYNNANESFDITNNEVIFNSIQYLSILSSFIISSCFNEDKELIIDYINSMKKVRNYLEYIRHFENIKFINNIGANTKNILDEPFKLFNNIYAIFVINNKQINTFNIKNLYTKNIKKIFIIDKYNILDIENSTKIKTSKFISLEDAFQELMLLIDEENKENNIEVILSPTVEDENNLQYYSEYVDKFIYLIKELSNG